MKAIEKNYKVFVLIGFIILVLSVLLIVLSPPVQGIDFKGGTVVTFSYETSLESDDIELQLNSLLLYDKNDYELYSNAEKEFTLETVALSENERRELLNILTINEVEPTIKTYTTISPTISAELTRKSLIALVIASLIIILYVAFAFRKVSYKISSWKYGFISIITLLFDILIPLAVFSILSQITTARLDILVVTAILAIIGYSINDTIVIFDRVRENLQKIIEKGKSVEFNSVIAKSVSQSVARSVNTSLTTVLALLSIYILGGEVMQWFSLTLLIGVVVGTYSSLFLASPLLILWEFHSENKKKDKGSMSEYEKAEQELLNRLK